MLLKNKPVMMINIGGVWQKRRLHIHVSVVIGDQKTQDYLFGRSLLTQEMQEEFTTPA